MGLLMGLPSGFQSWTDSERVPPMGWPPLGAQLAGLASCRRAWLRVWGGRKRVSVMGVPDARRVVGAAGCGRSPLLGSP